jgi:hypothetical protein
MYGSSKQWTPTQRSQTEKVDSLNALPPIHRDIQAPFGKQCGQGPAGLGPC